MAVYTTAPGVQLYTANHFDGSDHCAGRRKHEAFCLECQHFPDSPNEMEFPSTALRPGEEYRQITEHRFFTF
jgi:aldose 1-epimerase